MDLTKAGHSLWCWRPIPGVNHSTPDNLIWRQHWCRSTEGWRPAADG
jgi:hypothetical protein